MIHRNIFLALYDRSKYKTNIVKKNYEKSRKLRNKNENIHMNVPQKRHTQILKIVQEVWEK